MKEFRNNEYVWWNNEGWLYLGMDELQAHRKGAVK
jgi:hypothetical protein